jgi:hypothetical protein
VEKTTAGGETRTILSFASQLPAFGARARRGRNNAQTAAERCPGTQRSAAGKAFRCTGETKR